MDDPEMRFAFCECRIVCKNLIELCYRIDMGDGEPEFFLHIVPLAKFHHSRVEPNNGFVCIVTHLKEIERGQRLRTSKPT